VGKYSGPQNQTSSKPANDFQEAELSWREILRHFEVIKRVAREYCGNEY